MEKQKGINSEGDDSAAAGADFSFCFFYCRLQPGQTRGGQPGGRRKRCGVRSGIIDGSIDGNVDGSIDSGD
jgi:hypothetical protein